MSESDEELPSLHTVMYGKRSAPPPPRSAPAAPVHAAPQRETIDLTITDSDEEQPPNAHAAAAARAAPLRAGVPRRLCAGAAFALLWLAADVPPCGAMCPGALGAATGAGRRSGEVRGVRVAALCAFVRRRAANSAHDVRWRADVMR
jgi:hypothetical protein